VELAESQVVREVRLTFDTGADSLPTKITVTAGRQRTVVENPGQTVVVALPDGYPTRRVRVAVNQVFDVRAGFGGVGIAELTIPGVKAARTLAVPAPPATDTPASVVLTAAPPSRPRVFDQGRPICNGGWPRLRGRGPDRPDTESPSPPDTRWGCGSRRDRARNSTPCLTPVGWRPRRQRHPVVAASTVGVSTRRPDPVRPWTATRPPPGTPPIPTGSRGSG
jgi:arabinofuranan 3-O-arabinosyltransferase